MKTNVVNQLFKQKYWMRFELGISGLEEKAYFNEVMQRSYSICNFLFSKNDEVYVINRISYLKEDSMHEKLDMHRYFKTKRAVKHLEHQVFPYEYEDDEQMVTSEYRVRVKLVGGERGNKHNNLHRILRCDCHRGTCFAILRQRNKRNGSSAEDFGCARPMMLSMSVWERRGRVFF